MNFMNGFLQILQNLITRKKFKVESSCDGGESWLPVAGPVSREKAILIKKGIDHKGCSMVDIRVVPA